MSANRSFDFLLAAIDIDATLLGPDKQISRGNREAIAALQARGCRVALASGRRHPSMLPYHEELGLDGYVVSSQGARVEHAATGHVLRRAELDPATVAALIAEGHSRGLAVMVWLRDRVVAREASRHVAGYERLCDDPVEIADPSAYADLPVEKVIWSDDPARVAELAAEMAGRLGDKALAMVTEPWSLEFSAPDADKRHGVAALARRLGVPRERVLTFGDGGNDVGMLGWAGMGVAMPHGRPAARAAARLVAPEGDPATALARGVQAVFRQTEGALVA